MAFSSVDGSNGYVWARTDQCLYSSMELSDLVYIQSIWFNKAEVLKFNSTVGNWVGYSDFGVHNAKIWNNDPAIISRWRNEKDRYCKQHVEPYSQCILTKTGEHE